MSVVALDCMPTNRPQLKCAKNYRCASCVTMAQAEIAVEAVDQEVIGSLLPLSQKESYLVT